jgi:hypothetical protein
MLSRIASSRRLCLLTILSGALAAPAGAAVRMTVHAEFTSKATQPDATLRPHSRNDLVVELADNYVVVKDGARRTVYDFAQRRQLTLDDTAKTVDDYSLYAVAGFRELELRNRDGLAGALAAVKIDTHVPPVFDEQELSLQRPQGAEVAASKDGDGTRFASGTITLLHSSAAGAPVSAADATRFAQFLRYTYGGHPAILRALQQAARIPQQLDYSFRFPGSSATLALRIADVQTVALPANFTRPSGYTPRRSPGTDALDSEVERAWIGQAAPTPADRARAAETVTLMLRENRPFEAFLAYSELTLGGPGPLPAFDAAQKAQFQGDPSIRSATVALAARDPAARRQAADTLRQLRPGAGAKQYMLKLYEANLRAQLGERTTARVLFADVLQANPALAGPYKDAGDMYYMSFDAAHAWRCWDIARRLAPQFANVKAIDAFEMTLAARYPEYF